MANWLRGLTALPPAASRLMCGRAPVLSASSARDLESSPPVPAGRPWGTLNVHEPALRMLLERLAAGEASVDEAVRELRDLPFADLGFAKVDHHRELRLGHCEIVFGMGKTPEQVGAIVERVLEGNQGHVMMTRATAEHAKMDRRVAGAGDMARER